MTEKKRFVASVDESCIVDNLDNKGLYSVVDTVECLNELHEENKELKAKVDNKEVAVEVETCKVMEKIFDLIDKKIKELEDKYEFGRTEYRACPMHNIMFGINVLKELKRELEK